MYQPIPQPHVLGTTFEARVRDYMAAHTERIERFENAIFKQREEINDRMTEMFGILKELTTSRAPEKVLIMEEAKFLGAMKEDEAENEPNRPAKKEKTAEAPSSQPVEYYLKHEISENLIEGLVVLSSDLTNKIAYRKFLIKNGEEIFTDARDGVRIYPDGVASPAMNKLVSSMRGYTQLVHVVKTSFARLQNHINSMSGYTQLDIETRQRGDEVFSTWMAFGGNTRDLGSFGEETDEITDLHQDSPRIMFLERGDGVTSTKRRRRDLFGDSVRYLATAS
ncbi:hypothetical protein Tco_0409338 [Tanacetum coccineum]